jgi:hypothetical protein
VTNISDIKIIGIDKDRPPRIRKESYIDLFFRLSTKVPPEWCDEFNALGRQIVPSPKMDKTQGDCIETYVKDMGLIVDHLADLKKTVARCNLVYQEKMAEKARVLAATNASLHSQDGKQNVLNQIIDTLDFSD